MDDKYCMQEQGLQIAHILIVDSLIKILLLLTIENFATLGKFGKQTPKILGSVGSLLVSHCFFASLITDCHSNNFFYHN